VAERRVCAVTGGRADYGLLRWVMKEIDADPALSLQVVVTGMHLSPEFGLSYREVEADGFAIDARVEMLVSSDTAIGVGKSIGLGVSGFADVLDRLRPDVLLVLGDRFEILAAVQAALVARIPVAHIAGGDTTEGAFDESIRHAITKMAHLHFVTNEVSARRVRQLGENPAHVFNVGSPGIDGVRRLRLRDRPTLEAELGYRFQRTNLLVTFHPVTLDARSSQNHFRELLSALDRLGDDVGIVFTLPNADPEGRALTRIVEEYVATRPRTRAFASLGQERYLSLMAQMDAVVGNSSSGLYEAPTLGKPTVNIGDRQRGRLQAASVVNCAPEAMDIVAAIERALALDARGVINPYGDGFSAARICDGLRAIPDVRALLQKRFVDVSDVAHG
jgi:UDP-N-acetylglucosamine 2-epimerase (non-hydrolysing)/GDP/UDP-N,N'-diacetylbacillosamine 2-epimerase (hydrolysing)